jgi:hypothetical protein
MCKVDEHQREQTPVMVLGHPSRSALPAPLITSSRISAQPTTRFMYTEGQMASSSKKLIITSIDETFVYDMKQKKRGGNYAVFYFAKKRCFYIYDVITWGKKGKSAANHYSRRTLEAQRDFVFNNTI